MKKILIAAALAMAGCSEPKTETAQDAVSAAAPAPASPASATTSQWLKVAHGGANGGGVWVNPSLITTDPATGLTDVVLKVDHGDPEVLDPKGAANSLYRIERVTFRFNCADKTYAIAKREALNKSDLVLDTTETKVEPASFKPVAPSGVSSVAVNQACPAKKM